MRTHLSILFVTLVLSVCALHAHAQVAAPPVFSSNFLSVVELQVIPWNAQPVQRYAGALFQNADQHSTLLALNVTDKITFFSLHSFDKQLEFNYIPAQTQCTLKTNTDKWSSIFDWVSHAVDAGQQPLFGQMYHMYILNLTTSALTLYANTSDINQPVPRQLIIQLQAQQQTVIYDFFLFEPNSAPAAYFVPPAYCNQVPTPTPATPVTTFTDATTTTTDADLTSIQYIQDMESIQAVMASTKSLFVKA